MSEPLHPLRFEPHLVEKPWGGDRLRTELGRAVPEGVAVGESWELADVGEVSSRVAEGPLAGATLRELIARHPERLLGASADRIAPDGRFPVLVKHLDVTDRLSLQVHPDDEHARRIEGAVRGKSEMWWVLKSDPGAFVLLGPRGPIAADRFVASLEHGEDELVRHEPGAGDVVCMPAGVVHSAGGGLLLLEVQDSCEITYRLHDWGRTDASGGSRPLHRERALQVARLERGMPAGIFHRAADVAADTPLRTRRFSLKLASADAGGVLLKSKPEPRLAVVLDGSGRIRPAAAGEGHAAPFARGDVFLLPAGLAPHVLESDPAPRVLITCIGPREPAPWAA